MSDDDRFSRAGDVLKNLFDRLLPEDADGYTRFFSGWAKIAGAETAMHAYPRDIVNNVLILETDHPGWSQQIRMRQEGLLKTICSKYPDLNIKRIRVVIGNFQKNEGRREIYDRQKTVELKEKSEKTQPVPAEPRKRKSVPISEDEESFYNLLEIMRRRGDS